MGQLPHGCATTTEMVRRAVQHSQESLGALAIRYGINQKTAAKWKKPSPMSALPIGPKDARSTVLSMVLMGWTPPTASVCQSGGVAGAT